VFEPPVQQHPVFEPPTLDDYYSGDTPPMEFQLDYLLGGTANEIGGTQLTGAPPVTAADAADAGAATRDDGGLPRLGTACRRGVCGGSVSGGGDAADQRGAHPVRLGDSTCSDRRGASRRAQVLP
jgi:hypothetical protein